MVSWRNLRVARMEITTRDRNDEFILEWGDVLPLDARSVAENKAALSRVRVPEIGIARGECADAFSLRASAFCLFTQALAFRPNNVEILIEKKRQRVTKYA